jgi:hypothetical protein
MEMTLVEMLRIEQLKAKAEQEEKERIFNERHEQERKLAWEVLPSIQDLFKLIENDKFKFDIGVYDYNKAYINGHYAIVVKSRIWGQYMSNYEEVCIRPLEDGKFEVSRNYITKKEKISPQELVQRVLKYQQHGTMQNVMWIG